MLVISIAIFNNTIQGYIIRPLWHILCTFTILYVGLQDTCTIIKVPRTINMSSRNPLNMSILLEHCTTYLRSSEEQTPHFERSSD